MPSMTRTILIALHATAFIVLTQTAMCAVAAPLARPTILYTRSVLSPRNFSRTPPWSMRIVRNATLLPTHPAFARAMSFEGAEPENSAASGVSRSPADPYARFAHFYQAAKQNSKNLKKLAAQSASAKAHDPLFQKKCTTQLNAFHANIVAQREALSAIEEEKRSSGKEEKRSSGKGLANYDDQVPLEKLLKLTNDLLKGTLQTIYILVKNIPILGPILGPNAILNYSVEFLDGTINSLPPILKKLVGLSL
ncbi:hypothetical protein DXG01_000203 [Tephrocybe rancida]|nr:hypothetical protein DXG01_000203 [Tephrocybe rancida]